MNMSSAEFKHIVVELVLEVADIKQEGALGEVRFAARRHVRGLASAWLVNPNPSTTLVPPLDHPLVPPSSTTR